MLTLGDGVSNLGNFSTPLKTVSFLRFGDQDDQSGQFGKFRDFCLKLILPITVQYLLYSVPRITFSRIMYSFDMKKNRSMYSVPSSSYSLGSEMVSA